MSATDGPNRGNGHAPDAEGMGIGKAIAEALAARAAAVEVVPSAAVRTAVDRRIAHRARVRRTRRAVAATASAVCALVVVAGTVLLADRDQSDLATDDGRADAAETTTPGRTPPLVLGQSGDDPEDFGLPRVGFDADLDLQLQVVADPVVTTAATGPSGYGFERVQVFRREGYAVPVIMVPSRAPGTSGGPLRDEVPTTTITVNGAEAVLQGEPPGWAHLTWTLPDGTSSDLYAYGLPTETLVETAEGLRRTENGGMTGPVPQGFSEESLPAPAPDDVVANYHLELRRGEVDVRLEVSTATREEQAESLLTALTMFGTGENREVLGSPGVLLGVDTFWSAASDPRPGVTASVTINGATRSEVEEILTGLGELSAAEWTAALADDGG